MVPKTIKFIFGRTGANAHNTMGIFRKIEAGSQIGKTISFVKEGKTHWLSVGLQKHEGKYKVYISDILEEDMAAMEPDAYLMQTIASFAEVEDALRFISIHSGLDVADLGPCKGQRIFSPDHILF